MYKRVRALGLAFQLIVLALFECAAQIASFPYIQNVDSLTPPALPQGWRSSRLRHPGTDDFASAPTTPHSSPNAILVTNATLPQMLFSPVVDFSGETPSFISFYARRSSSFGAAAIVEASDDGGATFALALGDTLRLPTASVYLPYRLSIPRQLGNSCCAMFRWRVLPDTAGTSGTFRLDDISIDVEPGSDLAMRSIRSDPVYPEEGSPVRLFATIANNGSLPASDFTVELFRDDAGDSIPTPSEQLASVLIHSPLTAGDSVEVFCATAFFEAGDHRVLGRVIYPPDRVRQNNQLTVPLSIGYRPRSIVINEIMYAPGGSEPEWVELENVTTRAVNLNGWRISDSEFQTRHVITVHDLFVVAEGYCILTKDSAALLDAHPGIPAPILQVPSFPTLNNGGDAVVVYDNRGLAMDSLVYLPSWGGNSGGKSLERVDPCGESTLPSNWGISRQTGGSTPGRRNSRARKECDLALDSLFVIPTSAEVGGMLQLTAVVRNFGFNEVPFFSLAFFEDVDDDSIPEPEELVASVQEYRPLAPLNSVDLSRTVRLVHPGRHLWSARALLQGDEDTTNNSSAAVAVVVGYPSGSLRINEVMYAPLLGMPEWVELVNCSGDSIAVKGWRIGNRSPTSRYECCSSVTVVPAQAFVTITKDTALLRQFFGDIGGPMLQVQTLPTFFWNNNGDAVVVQDGRGMVMDSVAYRCSWGDVPGASLERIDAYAAANDSANWGASRDPRHGTPGGANSIAALDHDLCLRAPSLLCVRPGSPSTVRLTVYNNGKEASGQFRLALYDDVHKDSVCRPSELVAEAQVTFSLQPRDSLLVPLQWTRATAGTHLMIGILEYHDDLRLSNDTVHCVVRVAYPERVILVNEIMAEPFAGDAEYIELLNASGLDVDIAGWKVRDLAHSSGTANEFVLSGKAHIIHPGNFLVVASDSSVFRRFPYLLAGDSNRTIVLGVNSMSLNNDADAVILRDPAGWTVDSVAYNSSWHNPSFPDHRGRSLEKLFPSFPPNDARSWSTSLNPAGGTPGLQNSLFTRSVPSLARLSFAPNPFSPDDDGRDDFLVIHYEMPARTSAMTIKIFDVKGRVIRRLMNVEPGGYHRDVVWDGRDDDRRRAPIGIYVVLCEATDEQGGVVLTARGVVVLAGKL